MHSKSSTNTNISKPIFTKCLKVLSNMRFIFLHLYQLQFPQYHITIRFFMNITANYLELLLLLVTQVYLKPPPQKKKFSVFNSCVSDFAGSTDEQLRDSPDRPMTDKEVACIDRNLYTVMFGRSVISPFTVRPIIIL